MNDSNSHLDDGLIVQSCKRLRMSESELTRTQQAKELEAVKAHAALLWKTLDDFRRYQAVNAEYLNSPFAIEVDNVLGGSAYDLPSQTV